MIVPYNTISKSITQMNMKFDCIYTRVNVKNYQECKNFYSNILGFEATFEIEKSVEFETGTTKISLQKRDELVFDQGSSEFMTFADNDDTVVLTLKVKNLDEACEYLQKKGVELVNKICSFPNQVHKSTYIRDPDNIIELREIILGNMGLG